VGLCVSLFPASNVLFVPTSPTTARFSKNRNGTTRHPARPRWSTYDYDFETAEKFLKRAGFTRIINSDYNKSEFPELRVDYRGENLSLFVDAVK
jgi:hypothetical protein